MKGEIKITRSGYDPEKPRDEQRDPTLESPSPLVLPLVCERCALLFLGTDIVVAWCNGDRIAHALHWACVRDGELPVTAPVAPSGARVGVER